MIDSPVATMRAGRCVWLDYDRLILPSCLAVDVVEC